MDDDFAPDSKMDESMELVDLVGDSVVDLASFGGVETSVGADAPSCCNARNGPQMVVMICTSTSLSARSRKDASLSSSAEPSALKPLNSSLRAQDVRATSSEVVFMKRACSARNSGSRVEGSATLLILRTVFPPPSS